MLDSELQRILNVDARLALVWSCIEDGYDESEIVTLFESELGMPKRDARAEVARLAETLDTLVARPAGASAAEAPSTVKPRRPYPHPLPVHGNKVRVALLGTVFEIDFPSQILKERFRSTMKHLESDRPNADVRVVVAERAGGFDVVIDGEVVEDCEEAIELAPQVKSALCHAAINGHDFDACVHAAVVSWGGRVVLLPAESGSGKSCLALTLAGAGFDCLSDDMALFFLDGPSVRGVPAGSCVKEDAWDVIGHVHPALSSAPTHRRVDGKTVKYLTIATPDSSSRTVDFIVFPRFHRDGAGEPQLTPLEPIPALARLLGAVLAWRARLTPAILDGLIAWIETTRCYQFHYGPGDDTARIVEDLLRRDIADDPARNCVNA